MNPVRDYAWGSTTAFTELFGWAPSAAPRAEIWMGAHPAAPSRVQVVSASDPELGSAAGMPPSIPLPELLAEHPQLLGDAQGYGQLPFLTKILAVAKPLSIQAHPTPAQAEAGYAAENDAGIPLTAPHRNYGDPHHKPEAIVAVTNFTALCGFRPHQQAAEDLRDLATCLGQPHKGFVDSVTEYVARGDYRTAVEYTLTTAADQACQAADAATDLTPEGLGCADTVRRITSAFRGDPGLFVALMLNRVDLSPAEALYLPAGNLHAYLSGVGIEVMANSDNVLRGGLTGKHIDVAELLRIVETRVLDLPYCQPRIPVEGRWLYQPPVAEFQLERLQFPAFCGVYRLNRSSASILVCTAGEAMLLGQGEVALRLPAGESVFVPAHEPVQVSAERSAEVFITSTPDPSGKEPA
ncbi:mannose-6-phosphate isomerase, class I [Nesterenkonia alba]|uniref:mannose-6-phosphate isomerase, class I n=1 Tax=Nesterenkonia alba TaxID=515814 RepID=UPI001B7FE960|nr:mannose-6-phosphate isomerase, class I [Nesterenkonia alba]